MSLTKEEVLHLAKLSRLTIEEGELDTFCVQLDEILGYVGRLQAVTISDRSEAQIIGGAVVRVDVPAPSSSDLLEILQAEFPDRADHLLRVPGVFEKPKD